MSSDHNNSPDVPRRDKRTLPTSCTTPLSFLYGNVALGWHLLPHDSSVRNVYLFDSAATIQCGSSPVGDSNDDDAT